MNNILSGIIIALLLFNIFSTIHLVEKHSVHPLYGNYEQQLYKCSPWDSCK